SPTRHSQARYVGRDTDIAGPTRKPGVRAAGDVLSSGRPALGRKTRRRHHPVSVARFNLLNRGRQCRSWTGSSSSKLSRRPCPKRPNRSPATSLRTPTITARRINIRPAVKAGPIVRRQLPTTFLPISLGHKLTHLLVRRAQHRLLRQKHNSHVLRSRLLPEARTVHDQHMLLLQQVADESQVIIRNIERRMRIEGPFGRDQRNPWSLLRPLCRQITSPPQLLADALQMILWTFQRRRDRQLERMRRRQSR